MRAKVFCIGFHKTGTSSLRDALSMLGYRVTGPNFQREEGLDWPSLERKALAVAHQFDAFQDNPWPLVFRFMDEQFPGSRFILTLRDEHAWYASALRHFGSRETPMRRLIYGHGAPAGHEAIYRERYRAHNRMVADYFAQRPSDLLVMQLAYGDGWEQLCPFLGHSRPNAPFPRTNVGNTGRPTLADLFRRIASRVVRTTGAAV
jgi:hypothetical protein